MNKNMLLLILFCGAAFAPKLDLFSQELISGEKGKKTSLAWDPYTDYPVYTGNDLGVTWSPDSTLLKVWSPPAQEMKLRLYRSGSGDNLIREIPFTREPNGVWSALLKGDFKNTCYTVQAKIDGRWMDECADPYARATGVNGKRGEIVDLASTRPPEWENDRPVPLKNPTDAILYELHIRDLSVAPNSGILNKGKFLGLTETGTLNSHGQSTGLDHMVWLGITHVHLLPAFDYCSVDESKPEIPQFNWGYDPLNYNVPEGSYSTDATEGTVRIREFKQMVQALHQKGIGVVMDVVYNHTGLTHNSNFDQLVPGYYYRQWEKDGKYGNASACGNETASDRAMVRKFILESVTYWAREYHVDGFRFDLMAIHDMETMNQVVAAVRAINPSALIYGEGWTAGDSPLPEPYRALKKHALKMDGVAVFSDDIRDGIKGSVFDEKSTGFASGSMDQSESVKFGIVAAGEHPQIDYAKVNYSKAPYTKSPAEVVNYVSCHDNQTLYDKLKSSRPDAAEEELIRMHKLANTIVLTSQGIPFLHAGVEMKRTKHGEHNSYNKPDSVNQIDWDWKYENKELTEYYQALISLRKTHPAFRMPTAEMIRKNLVFQPVDDPQLIIYRLKDHANQDPWKEIMVILNGSESAKEIALPAGKWNMVLHDYKFSREEKTASGTLQVAPVSATILFQN